MNLTSFCSFFKEAPRDFGKVGIGRKDRIGIGILTSEIRNKELSFVHLNDFYFVLFTDFPLVFRLLNYESYNFSHSFFVIIFTN